MAWQTLVDPKCKCGNGIADAGLQCLSCRSGAPRVQVEVADTRPPFPGRVQLELPWSCLASDNLRTGRDKLENYRKRQGRYAETKARAIAKLKELYTGQPFGGEARVEVVVYVPDRRKRDGPNLLKMIGDALKESVLTADDFDVQNDTRIRRGGLDPDNPRAVITVEAM